MRAADVDVGRRYVLSVRVRICPVRRVTSDGPRRGGIGFAGVNWRTVRTVTVVDLVKSPGRREALAVVEAERYRCVNAEWFDGRDGRPGVAWAMVNSRLIWRPEPYRWTVPVRELLRLVDDVDQLEPDVDDQLEAPAAEPVSRGHLTLVAAS